MDKTKTVKTKQHFYIRDTIKEQVRMVATKKIDNRSLYLNPDSLPQREKIMVDIAIKRQELLKDWTWFLPLRHLFKKCDWRKKELRNGTGMQWVLSEDYYEDELGNPMNKTDFIETVNNIPPQIHVGHRVLVPRDLPADVARASGIPELVPIMSADFKFDAHAISILNTFAEDAQKLKQSSLLSCPRASSIDIWHKK